MTTFLNVKVDIKLKIEIKKIGEQFLIETNRLKNMSM